LLEHRLQHRQHGIQHLIKTKMIDALPLQLDECRHPGPTRQVGNDIGQPWRSHAQIFVANLVSLGMVREMGALMTAVIMAGRTGAAYAAQLGTMQTREEIDAIVTLGVSPMEFLVIPRVLALLVVMPMLVMYSNILGMLGGAIVALGMDITFIQYMNQTQGSVGFTDFATGLFKSVVFALLIGIAGCQAGLACGRSSAAVGQATTKAVVTGLVYLIVADAALNILYQRLGI
jgi:phospholipid/cholesterol/gamma-HCH transport system permease protein